MDAEEKTLTLFTTRVRQMILQYKELQEENVKLHAEIEKRNSEIANLDVLLAQAKRDYDSLKVAKMLEITNGDMGSVQKKMSKLIRDVNKCITLISQN